MLDVISDRLNPDVVRHIHSIIIQDTNLLVRLCVKKIWIMMLQPDAKFYTMLWNCTELFETLHDHLKKLNLRFSLEFNRVLSHFIYYIKSKHPECQQKFQYWILLQTWKDSLYEYDCN